MLLLSCPFFCEMTIIEIILLLFLILCFTSHFSRTQKVVMLYRLIITFEILTWNGKVREPQNRYNVPREKCHSKMTLVCELSVIPGWGQLTKMWNIRHWGLNNWTLRNSRTVNAIYLIFVSFIKSSVPPPCRLRFTLCATRISSREHVFVKNSLAHSGHLSTPGSAELYLTHSV